MAKLTTEKWEMAKHLTDNRNVHTFEINCKLKYRTDIILKRVDRVIFW